jgi:multiple sugar transport system permease protein
MRGAKMEQSENQLNLEGNIQTQNTPKRNRIGLSRSQRREEIAAYLFLLPSLGGFLVFYLIPFAQSFVMSFFSSPINGRFVWLNNYKMLLANPVFGKAALNTLIFTGIGVPLLMALSLMLAMALSGKLPGRKALAAAFLTPLVIPVASVVLVWQVFFDNNGALNSLLAAFGVARVDWLKSEWARFAVLLLFLWKNIGYNMVLYMAALAAVPTEWLESVDLDGANYMQKFRHIVWPRLLPTTLFVLIISIINSFKVFREVYLLAGAYPHDSIYTLQHFMNNMFSSLDYQKLTSAAFIMAVAIVGLMSGLMALRRRFSRYAMS